MELLTTKNFNGIRFDCYKADNARDYFWATREQIGKLLGYTYDPDIAIKNLHERNKERLDRFSRETQEAIVLYNFKGLLEICWRNPYSCQSVQKDPTAVIDFLWDIADGIRQTGFYATPNKIKDILDDPDSFIKVLQAYKTEKAKAQALSEQVAVQKQQIAELQPKITYYDIVLQQKGLVPITVIAKDYGWSGERMYEWLQERDVQVHRYCTQKQRLLIYDLMKNAGFLPLIEQLLGQGK